MAVTETDHLGNRCNVGFKVLSVRNMDDRGLSMFQDTNTIACVLGHVKIFFEKL